MSTLEKNLYKNLKITTPKSSNNVLVDKSYKGLSTVSANEKTFQLRNLDLIKQDILNHFHIKVGERLENPRFGCIIWDVLFEPLTEPIKRAVLELKIPYSIGYHLLLRTIPCYHFFYHLCF